MSRKSDHRDVQLYLKGSRFFEIEFFSCEETRKQLERLIDPETRNPTYVLVRHLPEDHFQQLETSIKIQARTDYFRYLQLAIIYLKMPFLPHNHVYGRLRDIFNLKIVSMGVPLSQFAWESDATHIGRRRSKNPDECFYRMPIRAGQWPALVIESGLSETMPQLRRDALWWFLQHGNVNYVLLIDLDVINEGVTIEKWERARTPSGYATRSSAGSLEPMATESVVKNRDGVVGTLSLSFEKLLGPQLGLVGPPLGPTQHDLVFSGELHMMWPYDFF